MWSGNPTHFTSTMQFTKSEKAFTKEKGLYKGHDQKDASPTKGKGFSAHHKKGFVRLDSFEDYEIIDLDMVNDQSRIVKSSSDYSINQNREENLGQMNFFNDRMYHPAAYVPPPYTYSDRNTGMSFRNQQQLQHPAPNFACQSARLSNQFSSRQPPCQISPNSQLYYPYRPNCPDASFIRSTTSRNLSTQAPFCDSDDEIKHHVPYNLTKGKYEYWMSVPGAGGNNSNCEAMQAYCHNQLPIHSSAAKQIPAQISKTVSSWVGGIYDWVASSVDLALKPNVPPSQNITFHTTLQSDSSPLVKPLNPNAKVFTPHATLNPNAKEFLPSTMASSTKTSIPKSSSVPTSIRIFQPTVVESTNMVNVSHSPQEGEMDQTPQMSLEVTDINNALDESDSELSQMVIEQLIHEANKEQKMEKLNSVEKTTGEISDSVTPIPASMEKENNHLQLKSVAARKTTPWVNLRHKMRSLNGLVPSTTKSTPTTHQATTDICNLTLPEDGDTETDDDGSDEDDFEDNISPKAGIGGLNYIRKMSQRKQSASSSCDDFEVEYDSSRVRSLSTCSDDSNFIEFGSPSTTPKQSSANCDNNAVRHCSDEQASGNIEKGRSAHKYNLDKHAQNEKVKSEKPRRCLLQAFVVGAKSFIHSIDQDKEEDTETDEEESDSDDDQDWDEVDGDDDLVDDVLWQSFKTRVLVCPMLSKESQINSNINQLNDGENGIPSNIGIISIGSIFLQNAGDPKPESESGSNPTKKTAKEIRDANKKWNCFYNSNPEKIAQNDQLGIKACAGNLKCNVTIAPTDSFITILEDPKLSVDLQKSRNGDYSCGNLARRKADKERMERLLSPIFQSEHRQVVLERLQREDYCRPENI